MTLLKNPSDSVSDAVASRRSLRAFLPDVVSLELLQDIMFKASRAPSSTKMQPWNVNLLTGESLRKVSNAVCEDYDNNVPYDEEQPYYPDTFFEPYLARRRKVGWDLYSLVGIEKGDKVNMKAQHRRNCEFFDAPAGAVFTIHRDLNIGS